MVSLTFYVAAVSNNKGTHLKYSAKGKEVNDECYGLLLRCPSIYDPLHKEIMDEKMEEWLRTNDSDGAANRWAKYWTRPLTSADCGYGNCTHQNHQELTRR